MGWNVGFDVGVEVGSNVGGELGRLWDVELVMSSEKLTVVWCGGG